MITRIHHYLAECGIESRRKSEEAIRAGRVEVNHQPILHSRMIDTERDIVTVDGRTIATAPKVYYVLHKPVNVVCSSVSQGDASRALDFVRSYKKMHLFTVGRLDKATSGLILVSNDGMFANRVLRPHHDIEKEYLVRTHDEISIHAIRQFSASAAAHRGYTIKRYHRISKKCISIVITEGKHHEIRNILRQCQCRIASLIRIRIDIITLHNLRVGAYREMSVKERASIESKTSFAQHHIEQRR